MNLINKSIGIMLKCSFYSVEEIMFTRTHSLTQTRGCMVSFHRLHSSTAFYSHWGNVGVEQNNNQCVVCVSLGVCVCVCVGVLLGTTQTHSYIHTTHIEI